jgi:hypothetical protein
MRLAASKLDAALHVNRTALSAALRSRLCLRIFFYRFWNRIGAIRGRRIMDRKEFLKNAGLATGLLALTGNACRCLAGEAPQASATACEKKQEFEQKWVKGFFDVLDANVDESARKKLMQANGKGCYQRGTKGKTIKQVSLDEYVPSLQKSVGKENCRREGDAIYFTFSEGSGIASSSCLCPMVESVPPGLSKTYCECSIGYVREMFQVHTGKSVRVELLESVKRGGKKCSFKILTA